MEDVYVQLLLVAISLLIGIVMAVLYMRANSVRRNHFEAIQNQLATTTNQLDTQFAIEQELRNQLHTTKEQIQLEQQASKLQATQFAQLTAQFNSLQERLIDEKQLNNAQAKAIEESKFEVLSLKAELAKVETIKDSLQEKILQQSDEFEVARKKSLLEFENIANKLFEQKTAQFNQQSKASIEQLLSPLKENIKEFKQKVEETYDKESKQRFSLENKIKELVQLNQQISEDATNLTNALKGQAKTQGDWGEMILENILEYSGLVKNREYFIQQNLKISGSHKRKQPDVIIKYPDNRYVIVDAKVSLVAYERYNKASSKEEQTLYLTQHIQSIKNHIDKLSSKEYEQFDKSLDFVMLFVPIEPAYLVALQADNDLWNYAYKKRILLISPTNLIASLKMMSDIWKREHQNKNAEKIAERGRLLYDKFVNFIAEFELIESHLNKATTSYYSALKKLSTGRGNLIQKADELRKLGVNSTKRLPERLLTEEE